jgi:hypothetical protein
MKILKAFPGEHEEKFDDAPFILPDADKISQQIPPEVPRVTFKSKLGKWTFQVARSRADVFLAVAPQDDILYTSMLYEECAPVLNTFITAFNVDISRLGAVCERYSLHENPGLAIATFFCKEYWTEQDGALNRPQGFELHAHKVYGIPEGFDINSWVRCRAGQVSGSVNGPAILIEQDINTLAQETERKYSIDECSVFFRAVSEEMDKIMKLYFPNEEAE